MPRNDNMVGRTLACRWMNWHTRFCHVCGARWKNYLWSFSQRPTADETIATRKRSDQKQTVEKFREAQEATIARSRNCDYKKKSLDTNVCVDDKLKIQMLSAKGNLVQGRWISSTLSFRSRCKNLRSALPFSSRTKSRSYKRLRIQ